MILMLFPPQWTPAAPSIGIPILKAHLEAASYKVDVKDLNINFFNDILTSNYLHSSYKKIKEIYPTLKNKTEEITSLKRNKDIYTLEENSLLLKFEMISKFLERNEKEIISDINNIEKFKQTYRSKEDFYDIRKLIRAQKKIENALLLAQLPFSPTIYYFNYHYNPLLKYNFENIKFHCFASEHNIFLEYYKNLLPNIIKDNHKLITISINSNSQLIPGLTLAYLIKKHFKNVHVNIGGDYFTRISANINKYPELFDLFVDSILTGDAEESIVELAKYADNKTEISSVSGLFYKKKDNIVYNNILKKAVQMNNVKNINLDGYELNQYYTPEIVLPLKSSRNCEWNKCLFCDLYYGKEYSQKTPEKLADEIQELIDKYNIKNFEFMDSAISPEYYNEFANILLKKKININFYSFARIETGFTKKLLNKLSKNGLKMLVWGYESASDRLIKLMNKKMDLKNRYKILKNSYECGIFNLAFTMLGFPTETVEEAKLTMDTLAKNIDYLQPIPPSICVVTRHSKLLNFMKKNNIKFELNENLDFDIGFDYACGQDCLKTIQKIRNEGLQEYRKAYKFGFPLYNLIYIRAHLLLYVSHYGAKNLSNNSKFRML